MKNTLKTKLVESSDWAMELTRLMCTECIFYNPSTKICYDNMMKKLGTVDRTCQGGLEGIHHEIIIPEKRKRKWKIL